MRSQITLFGTLHFAVSTNGYSFFGWGFGAGLAIRRAIVSIVVVSVVADFAGADDAVATYCFAGFEVEITKLLGVGERRSDPWIGIWEWGFPFDGFQVEGLAEAGWRIVHDRVPIIGAGEIDIFGIFFRECTTSHGLTGIRGVADWVHGNSLHTVEKAGDVVAVHNDVIVAVWTLVLVVETKTYNVCLVVSFVFISPPQNGVDDSQ